MSYIKIVEAFDNAGNKFSTSQAILVEQPVDNTFNYKGIRNRKFTAIVDTKDSADCPFKRSRLRIFFDSLDSIQILSGDVDISHNSVSPIISQAEQLSDEELTEIIEDKFFSVNKFAEAASKRKIRSLLVSGTAGTGKTFEVMSALEKEEKRNSNFHFSVVKGTISPIALYIELYNCRDDVLVLDDCDNALMENESLQLLKAATESHKTRKVSYKKMSKALEDYGIPQEFNFEGSVIILTNTDLERAGKNRLPHFEAIISRAHYVNAVLATDREKLLRIRSVIKNSGILRMFLTEESEQQDVIAYIEANYSKARELSVRTVVKIAELRAAFPEDWMRLANATIKK